jgi:hypothetical protein
MDAQTKHEGQPGLYQGRSYIPITLPPDYPALELKPLVLKRWFLIITLLFFGAVLAVLATTFVKHRASPEMFHIIKPTNYVLVATFPAIVGTATTLWWRAVVGAYWRIMPYIAMARTPISPKAQSNPQHFQTVTATSQLSAVVSGPGDYQSLAKERHYFFCHSLSHTT